MRRLKKRVKVALAISLFVVVIVAWGPTAAPLGRLMADFDAWRGDYVLLQYGLPGPVWREYVRLLQKKYGIPTRKVALCIVSHSLVTYADTYNEVMAERAKRKFGHDVFKECWDDARRNWELRQIASSFQLPK
jgi:hypothetical protein